MPTYAFKCETCKHHFDEFLLMADNNKPLSKPCPKCKKKTIIRDYGSEEVGMALDATLSPNKATGGAWNELMAKIKPGIPKRFRKNLDAASERRGG
jgi:putative FmdB family regulatory protein